MSSIISMLLVFLPFFAAGNPGLEQEADAGQVVEAVKAGFPSEEISLSGTITVRRMRGVVIKELGYTLDALWQADGGSLKGVFTDALGRETDNVDLTFAAGKDPVIKSDAEGAVDEAGRVRDTALECADLAMSFLWWKGAVVAGREETRGRDAYIVDFPAPRDSGSVVRVRAWIDSSIFIVLRADTYGAGDELIKQMVIKSFKKVDDRWMVKDLEITAGSSAVKTVITVEGMVIKTGSVEEKISL